MSGLKYKPSKKENMNNDKLKRLIKYKSSIENSLSSPVPPKHVGHPASYKAFLENELSAINTKVEELKGL